MLRAFLVGLVLSVLPSIAHGQELQLAGPLTCAPVAIYRRSPTLEWTHWVAAGFAVEGSTAERPLIG
jgi:hypothetical protein